MIPSMDIEFKMEAPETALSSESTFSKIKHLQRMLKKEGYQKALSKDYYINNHSVKR